MRLDDSARRAAGGGHARAVRDRELRGGIGRSPALHQRRADGGSCHPARAPQGLPAELRPVRRAALLRARQPPAGDAEPHRPDARDLRLRGLLAPGDAPAAGPGRRADPGQRLVLPGPRRRRDQRGRPGHGDLVAHDQSGPTPSSRRPSSSSSTGSGWTSRSPSGAARRWWRRMARPSSRRRSTTRGSSWSTWTWPRCGASGSRCPCCATSGRRSWCGSSSGSCGNARARAAGARRVAGACSVSAAGLGAAVRAAAGAARSTRTSPAASSSDFIRCPAAAGRLRACRPGTVGRDRLRARRLPRRARPSARTSCCAC